MSSKRMTALLLLFLLENFSLSGMECSSNVITPVFSRISNDSVYSEEKEINLKNTRVNKQLITMINSLKNTHTNKQLPNNKTSYTVLFNWKNTYNPYFEPQTYYNTCTIKIMGKKDKDGLYPQLQCRIITECEKSKKVTTYPNIAKDVRFRFFTKKHQLDEFWEDIQNLTIETNPNLPKIFKQLLHLISKKKT